MWSVRRSFIPLPTGSVLRFAVQAWNMGARTKVPQLKQQFFVASALLYGCIPGGSDDNKAFASFARIHAAFALLDKEAPFYDTQHVMDAAAVEALLDEAQATLMTLREKSLPALDKLIGDHVAALRLLPVLLIKVQVTRGMSDAELMDYIKVSLMNEADGGKRRANELQSHLSSSAFVTEPVCHSCCIGSDHARMVSAEHVVDALQAERLFECVSEPRHSSVGCEGCEESSEPVPKAAHKYGAAASGADHWRDRRLGQCEANSASGRHSSAALAHPLCSRRRSLCAVEGSERNARLQRSAFEEVSADGSGVARQLLLESRRAVLQVRETRADKPRSGRRCAGALLNLVCCSTLS